MSVGHGVISAETNNNCHNNCTIIYGLQLKPSGTLFCFTLVIITQ